MAVVALACPATTRFCACANWLTVRE